MRIDRCLCFDIPFARLKEAARVHGATNVLELQEHARFGEQCRLCHPYVRRMLRTGETVFHQILTEEEEPPGPSG
jgi:bacterioferritin-associated ferredoxin